MGVRSVREEAVPKVVSGQQPASSGDDLIGAHVRVVARRGYAVEGICLDAWELDHGGLAVKIKPLDGSSPREVTTLEPPIILHDRG
jgi:hypothetical protein